MTAFGAGAGATGETTTAARRENRALLDRAANALASERVEPVLAFGDAASEIASLAKAVLADVVVLGSHHHAGVKRWLLGSVSASVKDNCERSILLARAAPARGPILVALDDSRDSVSALAVATSFAERWGVELNAIHVRLPNRAGGGAFEAPPGAAFFEAVALDKRGVAAEINAKASVLGASLVVAGHHRLGKVRRAIAGSVSHQLARDSRASVLLVRAPLG